MTTATRPSESRRRWFPSPPRDGTYNHRLKRQGSCTPLHRPCFLDERAEVRAKASAALPLNTLSVERNRFAVNLSERLIAMPYLLSFPNVPFRASLSACCRLRPEEGACPGPPAGAGGPGHARRMDGRKRPATCRGRPRSRGFPPDPQEKRRASTPCGAYDGWAMALPQVLRSRLADVPACSAVLLPAPPSTRFSRRVLRFSLAFSSIALGSCRPAWARLSPVPACFSGDRGRPPTRHGAAGPPTPAKAARHGGLRAGEPSLLRGRAPRIARQTPPGIAWRPRAFAEPTRCRNGGFVQHGSYEIRLSSARDLF